MKIEEQVLSREQMAHLKELGVDISDASMMWYRCVDAKKERWYLQINNELSKGVANVMNRVADFFVPTYTIGDLIEKLPKDLSSFSLAIQYEHDKIGYYETSYGNIDIHHEEDLSNNPILGLYNMLCWVAENHKELIR